MSRFFQSEPFHFWAFSALLMGTIGTFVFGSDELFAPTDARRKRFQTRAPC